MSPRMQNWITLTPRILGGLSLLLIVLAGAIVVWITPLRKREPGEPL